MWIIIFKNAITQLQKHKCGFHMHIINNYNTFIGEIGFFLHTDI